MYTPGIACRVNLRERLSDDIPPQDHGTRRTTRTNDAPRSLAFFSLQRTARLIHVMNS